MAANFWDELQKGKIIKTKYYTNLLDDLKKNNAICTRIRCFSTKIMQVCPRGGALAKFNELGYELFPNPPYSPDSVPRNYFLHPNLKDWLGGMRYVSTMNHCSNTPFDYLNKSFNMGGLENWRNLGPRTEQNQVEK